ncbi:MAG TPA: HD domain-containing phosphohydrolase [Terriglobales bacterium]|nr:HD domain-containing phosphohydrolase [Terriglobales bacterium]
MLGRLGTKLTNKFANYVRVTLFLLWFCFPQRVALQKDNFRRLLRTVEALSDLGPEMTAEREFPQIARAMLSASLEAGGAREGALFIYSDRPSLLTSVAADGFVLMPEPAVVPLLPRHVHSLMSAREPVILDPGSYDLFISANGNVAPELFKCIVPLKVASKLVGIIALGRRDGDSLYDASELEALGLLSHYVALAIHNHSLTQTLAQRVSENLRLMASLHGFYDNALEAFATAIDVKHINIHGHSLRVGRYASAIGEAMGMDPSEVAAIRSAGYLHDIGKVAVDKRLFGKPTSLDAEEFREMADHTVVGHQIVSGVQFPWPRIAEIVRWHHERSDGSGYPDGLLLEDVPMQVRIVGLADTFDAMTSERPYRERLSLGSTLNEIVRLTPQKFDPNAVHALLLQVRRDTVGSNRTPFLQDRMGDDIAAADVDQLAASLQHKMNHGRLYLT